jgi:hypothetical protein
MRDQLCRRKRLGMSAAWADVKASPVRAFTNPRKKQRSEGRRLICRFSQCGRMKRRGEAALELKPDEGGSGRH